MNFINRCKEVYYAFEGKTKTGKAKYFASKKPTSDKAKLVSELPEEFEFYENPANATVTIRRRKASQVTTAELELLTRICSELTRSACRVVIEGDNLVVYTALVSFAANFEPEMQFSLVDRNLRTFSASRYCYRSSIDGWMKLHYQPCDLNSIATHLVKHLGKESFFEQF